MIANLILVMKRKSNRLTGKMRFPDVFMQGGFDVVIGNPPYFSLDIVDDRAKRLLGK